MSNRRTMLRCFSSFYRFWKYIIAIKPRIPTSILDELLNDDEKNGRSFISSTLHLKISSSFDHKYQFWINTVEIPWVVSYSWDLISRMYYVQLRWLMAFSKGFKAKATKAEEKNKKVEEMSPCHHFFKASKRQQLKVSKLLKTFWVLISKY